jgi:hypothetical protein
MLVDGWAFEAVPNAIDLNDAILRLIDVQDSGIWAIVPG